MKSTGTVWLETTVNGSGFARVSFDLPSSDNPAKRSAVIDSAPLGPIAGFFAGIKSSVRRTVIALSVILAASIICVFCAGVRHDFFWISFAVLLGVIFVWGGYGAWFFVGLLALIGMVAFLITFVRDQRPVLSLFLTFSTAMTYLAPITFSHHHWVWLICFYFGLSVPYWLLSYSAKNVGTQNI